MWGLTLRNTYSLKAAEFRLWLREEKGKVQTNVGEPSNLD